jgi:hypothetical protein
VTEVAVSAEPDGTYRVEVRGPQSATTHLVAIPPGYPAAIGCADVPAPELIRASFAFLLEREPGSAILRRFRLDEIADYFPDYPTTITQRLANRA